MIYYLNMGFILEQALTDVIKRYIDRQQFDDVYGNFHISVVNEHPFAHMIVDTNARAADIFPSIVITSQSDTKPSDLNHMPPQIYGVGYTSNELEELISNTKRIKTKINEKGEVVEIKKNGEVLKEKIPGFVFVSDEETINRLKEIADSRTTEETEGRVWGIKVDTRRRDHVSIEIWAENNQLKNELYEHLRILLSSTLESTLQELYSMFDPSIFDNSVNGERSSNYNFDFDCLLCGSHITCDIDYNVSQIILDTDIEAKKYDLIVEVMNHVKE